LDDGLRAMPGDVDSATDFGTPGSLNVCSGTSCLPGDVTPQTAANLGKSFPNIWNTKDKTAGPDFDIGLAGGKLFEMDGGDLGVYAAVDYSSSWESRQDATIDDPREGQYSYERSQYGVDLTAYLALEYDNGDNQYRSKTIVLRKSDDLTKVQSGVNLEGTEETDVILQWTERQFVFQQFSGEHAFSEGQHVVDWHVGAGQSFRNQPDRRSYAFVNGIATPLTAERRYQELTEDSFDARLDYSFVDFYWTDNVRSTVKVGVYTSAKDRENKLARFGFRTNGFDTAGLDFEEVMAPENFDDESIALRVRTSSTDSYNSTDNLSAFYGSLETTFYDTVDVIFGARQETAEQVIDYPNSTQDQSVYKTDELLPMLAATWRIDETFQLRAGFSQTLARPGIVERSQSQLFDPETDQAVTGNPDLVISEISNLDLRLEMYLTDDSSMSWALFTKDITNPIEKTTIPQCSGTACEGYTFANQESATVSGFEYDFTTNIIDGASWSAFLSGNIAFIDSEVTLGAAAASSEGQSKRKLQGQSDVLANMQIGFDHLETMQSFTLVANFFDDRIYEIQRNGDDKIEYGRMIFDFIYNWDISESLRLNAKVKNIFNEKVSYSRSDEEIESYTEGTEIEAKVTWRF
jgi:outer membrane receptor protein involved in Fe transport